MDLNKNDFARLQYNVYELPEDKKVLETWPELNRFPEFTTRLLVGEQAHRQDDYSLRAHTKRYEICIASCRHGGFI